VAYDFLGKARMKYQLLIPALAVLLLVQTDEIKLDAAQAKITTVSAMRVRRAPQVGTEEISRLKLGTVVSAVARSANQDTVAGKTDYWYRVNLPNGETGWLFGGLLLDYDARQRNDLLRQIIEARLKAENTDFFDRQEIYNLATSSVNEAKDANTRAEFELLKLLALANQAVTFPDNLDHKSPYREWLKTHSASIIRNEFGGGYNLRSEMLWNLETKYHSLPMADRIAWEAAQNQEPSDCEGDEVCNFFRYEGEIKYLNVHPNGAHAAEAIKNLTEMLTDAVITAANDKNSDQYVVEYRNALRKQFASIHTALAKTSAPEKTELLKKLERVDTR
jgi:Bacterial SH3 domain